ISGNGIIVGSTENSSVVIGAGATDTFTLMLDVGDSTGCTGSCSKVVVIQDTVPPLISCPTSLTVNTAPGSCASNVTFSVSTSDTCGVPRGASVPARGFVSPVGVTTVTSPARDSSVTASPCSFTVTVLDNQPPQITCPANLTVNAAPGSCSSNVTFTVSADDNCAVTNVTSVPASGFAFPVGTTTVTSIARDSSGNSAMCSFTVTG